jgi:hypothetical protein
MSMSECEGTLIFHTNYVAQLEFPRSLSRVQQGQRESGVWLCVLLSRGKSLVTCAMFGNHEGDQVDAKMRDTHRRRSFQDVAEECPQISFRFRTEGRRYECARKFLWYPRGTP